MAGSPITATAGPAALPPRRPNRQRARTRAALLQAGRRLLALRTVDALSVDEIVVAADVAKGSFYNHFSDKDMFAREIGAEVRREAENAVLQANREISDPALRLARAVCVFVSFAITRPDSAQVLWRLNSRATIADAPINRGLHEELTRARKDADFRLLDLEAAMLMVMGTIVIAMRHVLEERVTTPPGQIARQLSLALLHSLGVPVRRARAAAVSAVTALLESQPPAARTQTVAIDFPRR
jgi:AcrR family transcriptional regulator